MNWCDKVKNAVNENFEGLDVEVNTKAPEYLTKDKSKINSICLAYPRLGSFEVYLNSSLVFSKLSRKNWPNIQNLLGKIMFMLNSNLNHSRTLKINSEITSLESERRNSNQSNQILDSKNLKRSSNGFLKAEKNRFKEKFSKSKKKKPELNLVNKNKKVFPIISSTKSLSCKFNKPAFKVLSTKSSSRESLCSLRLQKRCDFDCKKMPKFSKSDRIGNNLSIKSYKISVPLNKTINKKIPLINPLAYAQTLTVESSEKDLIHIKTPEIVIQGNSTEYIKFSCLSKGINISKTVIINLKIGTKYFSAYELELEYK